jgi:hypothetical protein
MLFAKSREEWVRFPLMISFPTRIENFPLWHIIETDFPTCAITDYVESDAKKRVDMVCYIFVTVRLHIVLTEPMELSPFWEAISSQLFKNFPTFCGTRRFAEVLSWGRSSKWDISPMKNSRCMLPTTAYSWYVYLQVPSISGGRLLHPQPEEELCLHDKGPTFNTDFTVL